MDELAEGYSELLPLLLEREEDEILLDLDEEKCEEEDGLLLELDEEDGGKEGELLKGLDDEDDELSQRHADTSFVSRCLCQGPSQANETSLTESSTL